MDSSGTTALFLSHTTVTSDERILRSARAIQDALGYAALASDAGGVSILLKPGMQPGRNRSASLEPSKRPLQLGIKKRLPRLLRNLLQVSNLIISLFRLNRKIYRHGKAHQDSIGLIHANDFQCLPAALMLGAYFNSPVIYDAHELEKFRAFKSQLEGLVVHWIERFAWKRLAGFTTVNQSILDWYLGEYGQLPARVVANSPERLGNGAGPSKLRADLKIPEEDSVFLYCGLLTVGRGIHLLLDIFEEPTFADSHVVFLGHGPLSNLIKRQAVKFPRIHYVPPVPHEELIQYIRGADYGLALIEPVSLSYKLSLPNKLLEYAAAGLPSIVSNGPELLKFIETTNSGISVEFDRRAVTEALKRISSLNLKQNFLPPEYTWETQKRNLISLVCEVTKAPFPEGPTGLQGS